MAKATKATPTTTPDFVLLVGAIVVALRNLISGNGLALTLYCITNASGKVIHAATSKTSIVGHGPDCVAGRIAQNKVVHYPHSSMSVKGATVQKLTFSLADLIQLCEAKLKAGNATATKHEQASDIRRIIATLDGVKVGTDPVVAEAFYTVAKVQTQALGIELDA